MAAAFLAGLREDCEPGIGLVPSMHGRYEPLAAIYPIGVTAIAKEQMEMGRLSLQDFVQACVEQGLVREMQIAPSAQSLFLNLNTPNELSALR